MPAPTFSYQLVQVLAQPPVQLGEVRALTKSLYFSLTRQGPDSVKDVNQECQHAVGVYPGALFRGTDTVELLGGAVRAAQEYRAINELIPEATVAIGIATALALRVRGQINTSELARTCHQEQTLSPLLSSGAISCMTLTEKLIAEAVVGAETGEEFGTGWSVPLAMQYLGLVAFGRALSRQAADLSEDSRDQIVVGCLTETLPAFGLKTDEVVQLHLADQLSGPGLGRLPVSLQAAIEETASAWVV